MRVFSWRPGGYLRTSGNLLTWLLLRASAQVATILLLTRLLGADGYGLFVSTLAISSFFTPIAGLGMHGILLRDGARNPSELPRLVSSALAIWWPSTIIFSVAALLAALWFSPYPLPLTLLATFVFSEIASSSLTEIAGRIEQSQHHTKAFGALQAGLPLSRLAALLIFAILFQPDTMGWISIYTASSLAYTFALVWRTQNKYHLSWPCTRDWHLVRDGFPFTIGALSFRLQAEFNKPMLAQTSYAQAGNFSAAQRVVDLASIPLTAMQETLWPRYYANLGTRRSIFLLSLFLVATALLCGALLALSAPLLPYILGAGFEETMTLLVHLAWLPTLQTIRNLMNAAVISNNKHSYLTWVYLCSGLTSILLNSILIPNLGLHGAIWSSYLTELLAISMLILKISYNQK